MKKLLCSIICLAICSFMAIANNNGFDDEAMKTDFISFGNEENCNAIDVIMTLKFRRIGLPANPHGIRVIGDFNNYDFDATEMTHLFSTNAHTVDVVVPASSTIHFLFVNGITLEEAEILPDDCSDTVTVNGMLFRTLETPDTDFTTGVYKFETCLEPYECPAVFAYENPNLPPVHPSCTDGADGVFYFYGSGIPLEASLDGGPTLLNQTTIENLSSGSHQLIVRNFEGCLDTLEFTLSNPSPIEATVTTDPLDCAQGILGAIHVVATGGTGNLQCEWSTGASGFDLPNIITAGNYAFTIVDENGCTYTDEITIAGVSCAEICGLYIYDNFLYLCDDNGTSDNISDDFFTGPGLAGATSPGPSNQYTISDGNNTWGPYTYDGLVDPLPQFPAYGEMITLTFNDVDNPACQASVFISEASCSEDCETGMFVQMESTDVSCYGDNDGSVSAFGQCGIEPYTYFWENFPGENHPNVRNLLGAGYYRVTVTDALGQTATGAKAIDQPGSVGVECFQTATNAASIGGGGGTPPIVVTLSGPDNFVDTLFEYPTTLTVNWYDLGLGDYEVNLLDANGCTSTCSFTMIQMDCEIVPAVTIASCDNNNTPADPTDDLFDLAVSADMPTGAGAFTVRVLNNFGVEYGPFNANESGGTTGGILADIPYEELTHPWFELRFENVGSDCYAVQTLSENIVACACGINVNVLDYIEPTCNGGTDGLVSLITMGGIPPVLYSLDGGTFISGTTIFNVGAGNHQIIAVDAEGCLDTVYFTLNDPPAIEIDFEILPYSCEEAGSITVNAAGGTGVLNCTWAAFPDLEDCTILGLATQQFYNITITDEAGCVAFAEIEMTGTDCEETCELIIGIGDFFPCFDNGTPNDPNDDYFEAFLFASANNPGASGQYTITDGITVWGPFDYDTAPEPSLELSANGLDYNLVFTDVDEPSCTSSIVVSEEPCSEACEIETTIINSSGPTCNGGTDGFINTITAGAIPPVFYSIDGGVFQPGSTIFALNSGDHELVASDAEGCQDTVYFTLEEPVELLLQASVNCTNMDLPGTPVIVVTVSGGVGPYTYIWSNGLMTQELYDVLPGIYNITVTGANGCVVEGSYEVSDCVWPGDTDNNSIVNNFDLLNIGIAYDSVGPARAVSGFSWFGHVAENWPWETPETFVNFKHADTDGNGIVESGDTLAININWEASHNFTGTDDGYNFNANETVGMAPFYVLPDSLVEGAFMSLPVILGEENLMIDDAYGLAFSIAYDSDLIVPGSVKLTFDECWIGDLNNNMITMQRDFYNQSHIAAGMTRIDGANMSGFGEIARLEFIIEDDILFTSNEEDDDRAPVVDMTFQVFDVKIIDFEELEILVNPVNTSAPVVTNITTINLDQFITLYPNPARSEINLTIQTLNAEGAKIYSLEGKLMKEFEDLNSYNVWTLNGFPAGSYFLEVMTGQGRWQTKFVVMK